jgi:hypothetical protein
LRFYLFCIEIVILPFFWLGEFTTVIS